MDNNAAHSLSVSDQGSFNNRLAFSENILALSSSRMEASTSFIGNPAMAPIKRSRYFVAGERDRVRAFRQMRRIKGHPALKTCGRLPGTYPFLPM